MINTSDNTQNNVRSIAKPNHENAPIKFYILNLRNPCNYNRNKNNRLKLFRLKWNPINCLSVLLVHTTKYYIEIIHHRNVQNHKKKKILRKNTIQQSSIIQTESIWETIPHTYISYIRYFIRRSFVPISCFTSLQFICAKKWVNKITISSATINKQQYEQYEQYIYSHINWQQMIVYSTCVRTREEYIRRIYIVI